MNVIIPIGGAAKAEDGTEYIRSLREIQRKTIIQYVFESLEDIPNAHYIVIIRREDILKYHMDNVVSLLRPEVDIIVTEGSTKGSACTCLLAVDRISNDSPLLIVGADQLLTISAKDILETFKEKSYDGGVVIFEDIHPRWSYVKLDAYGYVVEAAEKRPISRNATTGFYYFKSAEMFIEAAKQMIMKEASVKGQFYVCPAYNELVLWHKKIGVYRVQKEQYYNFNHQAGIEAYEAYLEQRRMMR